MGMNSSPLRCRYYLVVFFLLVQGVLFAQANPDSLAITLADSLPLHSVRLQVDPKFSSTFAVPESLWVPDGFSVNVFATGITGARGMCWSPDSVLYVCAMGANANAAIALPDHNHDGIADSNITVATGLNHAHSLQFYRDTLYVAETNDVLKMIDANNDRVIDTRSVIISGILTGGNHTTRTLLFDEPAHKLYLSVGSSCNMCDDLAERACILQFNDDGSGKKVFASGLRNSVGLAFHPVTHALWANNNGFDNAGDDIPPEVVNIIEDGRFYGWPVAYGDKRFNPIFETVVRKFTRADTVKVLGMRPPVVQMQAHSAPLGMMFYTGEELPAEYHNSGIMCFHGSWNRTPATGERVIRFRGNNDGTNMRASTLITGWMTDSINLKRWGRPVDVIADRRGNLYVSDDFANAIYRVHYTAPTAVHEGLLTPGDLRIENVHPNPSSGICTVSIMAASDKHVDIDIINALGDVVASITNAVLRIGPNEIPFDASKLPTGNYRARIAGTNGGVPVQITR